MVKDKFISFKETDHEHPYDDPDFLKIEEIFSFMMCYRKPYSDDSRKSLKNYRNRLRNRCKECTRLPTQSCIKYKMVTITTPVSRHLVKHAERKRRMDACRVFFLKQAMSREIKGITIQISGNRYLEKVLVSR